MIIESIRLADQKSILLTFDIEDWFQVENFRTFFPISSWSSFNLRVERNTHRILDLLESVKDNEEGFFKRNNFPRATFFVLGWVAERLPQLIKEIKSRGHEIASHGYFHRMCQTESMGVLKQDLVDSKKLLEDITGGPICGYRAPSFSINSDTLKLVEESGYIYDSSFNSFPLNRRYGKLKLSPTWRGEIPYIISKGFFEIPVSNLKLWNIIMPWGGGGYFRILPLKVFILGVKSILKSKEVYVFYLHPWEIDSEKVALPLKAPMINKIRHHVNINRTMQRLDLFINNFRNYNFITCMNYLEKYQEE